jgi:uncharacterized repeat protein (TIGR01451 family)
MRKLEFALVAGMTAAVGLLAAVQPAMAAPPKTADLAVAVADNPDPATVGTDLTYTITVSNAGPSSANATVTNDVDPSMKFESATPSQGSCSGSQHLSCVLGTVAKNARATVTIRVRPTTSGTFSDTAAAQSDVTDSNTGNNSATASTTVNPDPRIATVTLPATATSSCAGFLLTLCDVHFRTYVRTTTGGTINEGTVRFSGEGAECTGPVINSVAMCDTSFGRYVEGPYHADYSGSATYAPSSSVI